MTEADEWKRHLDRAIAERDQARAEVERHRGGPEVTGDDKRRELQLPDLMQRAIRQWAEEDTRRAEFRRSVWDLFVAAGKGDRDAAKKLEVML